MLINTYSSDVYNSLPSLGDAGRAFDAIQGKSIVESSFKKLFLEHNMDRKYGLTLLHQHFKLEDDEKLVDYRGTSVPWVQEKSTFQDEQIRPANWMISDEGNLIPYEFVYSVDDSQGAKFDITDPKTATFLAEFQNTLADNNAKGLFGICPYPGDDFGGRMEITQDRANINLKPGDYDPDTRSRTAAWFFSAPLWERGCNCKCLVANNGMDHTGHDHRATR
ncbi:hypothetical protein ONS96_010541 [Cadophora gregata f. sp. sojae]|nr:hypothetical protein ONS96_010541 [Cadophora gregata f. sp. sojae]